jgi:hypothetical protein
VFLLWNRLVAKETELFKTACSNRSHIPRRERCQQSAELPKDLIDLVRAYLK